MAKELDIKKIIKEVQTEADKKSQKRFDGMMEVIKEDFKIVKEQFKGVYERFDKIDRTLDSHTEEIGKLEVNVEAIRMDVEEIKSDTKRIKLDINFQLENKVDKKHFVSLDNRIRTLEKK